MQVGRQHVLFTELKEEGLGIFSVGKESADDVFVLPEALVVDVVTVDLPSVLYVTIYCKPTRRRSSDDGQITSPRVPANKNTALIGIPSTSAEARALINADFFSCSIFSCSKSEFSHENIPHDTLEDTLSRCGVSFS